MQRKIKNIEKELKMENEKHFKLLKEDSIEIDGVKLYRIQATKNLPQHYIAKGEKRWIYRKGR